MHLKWKTNKTNENCPMIEKLETEGCSKDACIITYTHVKTFIQLEKTICTHEKVNPVDCNREREQVFNVNMLKLWHERVVNN